MTTKSPPLLNPQFSKIYPGPFRYSPGSDWVNSTFDVYCISTEQHVLSTFYWDERERAELVAYVLTCALEFCHSDCKDLDLQEWKAFRQIYPGPYYSTSEESPGYGPIEVINSHSAERSLTFCYDRCFTGKAKLVAPHVVAALELLSASVE